MTHKAQDANGEKMSERDSVLKHNDDYDTAVVIPTCGGVQLIHCVARVAVNSGNKTRIVLSLNPMDKELAQQTKSVCENVLKPADIKVDWVESDVPLGFGGAVNAGIDFLKKEGFPKTVIVLNDDTLPSGGWVDGINEAFNPKTYNLNKILGEGQGQGLDFDSHPAVGIVGPVTNMASRDQYIDVDGLPISEIDGFADEFTKQNQNNFISTNFISGFCMALSRDLIADLINADGFVFDPIFNERIGGFEDNDICLRAQHMGYGLMIAGQTYVHHIGHQTIANLGIANGIANYTVYLDKWSEYTQRDQKIAAAFRVKLETANDLFVFKEALKRAATLCDSISVLFTGNPSNIVESQDFSDLKKHLEVQDQEFLNTTSICDENDVAGVSRNWIEQTVKKHWHSGSGDIACETWDGFFNERDERNHVLSMTHQFSPDWIISIDHDEMLESRVDRLFVEKLMKNPNPEVMAYDFSWINHWNSPDYVRVDSPWGDNGQFVGGMRGARMYRHVAPLKSKIVVGTDIGLHCGNIPAFSTANWRCVNARFHHYGYMRSVDRIRKYQTYTALDTTNDASLLGTKEGNLPYQHLVDEVNMMLAPTPRGCGVAFTGLAYEGEDPHHLVRVLEHVYTLVDQVCMVWTDPKIKTPSEEWELIGKLYGIDWVVSTFDGDLAKCRNAGLERLRQTKSDQISWVFSLDLDEYMTDYLQESTMIRRMVENPKPISYLFTFVNSLGDFDGEQRANESQTHRLFRLDESFGLKWEGKVHEGLGRSIQRLRETGFPANFAKARFKLLHVGLNKPNHEIHQKLEKYGKMLYQECKENPNECMPWVSLGLHFLNDGRTDEAVTCFNYAIATEGVESWMAHKELGAHYMRMAKASYALAKAGIDEKHDMYGFLSRVNEGLEAVKAEFPYIGLAKEGLFFQSEVKSLPDVVPDNVKMLLEQHFSDNDKSLEDETSSQDSLNK